MKVFTIIGARPQFVKAAVVSKALLAKHGICEFLVHTGQHFDENMSRLRSRLWRHEFDLGWCSGRLEVEYSMLSFGGGVAF
jgi:UDP-N-acetylglucosamine 2-epimerase